MKRNHISIFTFLAGGLLIANTVNAQWSRNQATSSTFLTNINDKVGIGTNTPAFVLDVQGAGNQSMSFKSTNNTANLILDRGNAGNTAGVNYRLLGNPQWQTGCINTDNYVIRNVNLGSAAVYCSFATNNVGVGTTSPTEKLHVAGNILASGNVNATNVTASGIVKGATVTSTGNVNAVNFLGSGNIDVSGYVGFGSIEQFTDGGSSTIASNSSIVPLNDCGISSLGSSTKRWNNIFACGDVAIGTTTADVKLHVTGGTDVAPTGGGFIQAGASASINVAIDNNEIMARNNGAVATLFLNDNGGDVCVDGAGTGTGNFGIGTAAPASSLHIVHPSGLFDEGLRLERQGVANYWTFYVTTFGTSGDLWFNNNGVEKGEFASSNGVYTSVSDRRLKSDIRDVGSVLDKVMTLGVKNYYITSDASKRNNLGLIAQDVEPLFPELVYHSVGEGRDIYTMDYAGFGVISIKAIQEQQKNIEKKSAELDAVKKEMSDLKESMHQLEQSLAQCCSSYNEKSASGLATDAARLEQNAPNPFSQSTVIKFYIPQNFKSAQVKIYSSLGDEMKVFNIATAGVGQVEISANTMVAGIYNYTLIIDGKAIDSKQMIMTK